MPDSDNGENIQQKPNFVSWPQKHLFWQEIRKLGTKYIYELTTFWIRITLAFLHQILFLFQNNNGMLFLNSHILEYEKNRTVFKFDFINGFALLYPILRGKKLYSCSYNTLIAKLSSSGLETFGFGFISSQIFTS